LYFNGRPIKIELIKNLLPEHCKNRYVILDEADYAIENYAAFFE